MSNERETIKDISVEVRETNGGIADRLDAAYDRMKIASNAVVYEGKVYYEQPRSGSLPHGMAVQDALSDLVKALEFVHEKQQKLECINLSLALAYQRAKEALKYPPRNCDVLLPQEMQRKFDEFCVSHYTPPNKDGVVPDGCDCQCYVRGKGCNVFAWAQLPYNAETGNAGKSGN